MKTIISYQTDDGSCFNNVEEALKYEQLYGKCLLIDGMLKNTGERLGYDEYIQQDINVVKKVIDCFMDLVSEEIPEYSDWAVQVKNGGRHISHIGRILDDYDIKCFDRLYYRLSCISLENGKEFQQPYFVDHQGEATKEVL